MSQWVRLIGGTAVSAVILSLFVGTGTASAVGAPHQTAVAEVPSDRTPHVLDGTVLEKDKVLEIEQVGDRVVVAGEFTDVQDSSANGGRSFVRNYVFAFDATTGAVDQSFVPAVDGVVRAVTAGPDGTVFLGGSFTTVNGQTRRNLAQVSLADGSVTGFRVNGINGSVSDLQTSGGRLFLGGFFNRIDNQAHGGLATIDPATGAVDPYMSVDVAVNHNYPLPGSARASVGVRTFDISPDGSRLVAVGNFKTVEGQSRDQAVQLLLPAGGAVVDPGWRTRRYEPACLYRSFDYYVRDVEFSPDGSFFVIVTTGAAFPGTLCDTAARWETTANGDDVQPTWAAYTGGDTLFSVAVTGPVVYVGGHQRWLNNAFGRDTAGAGAVARPGLAALDARSGVPLTWNAARHPRGIGAEALLATPTGLYVGSDTAYIGNRKYKRERLAFLPLADGAMPQEKVATLPADVYLGGQQSATGTAATTLVARNFTGTTATADVAQQAGDLDWSRVRGAFMADDTLFYGYPDSAGAYWLYRRTFDGQTFGDATQLNPYIDPYWSTVGTGSGSSVYRGALPNFYGQLSGVSAMFYQNGKLFYTRTGASGLYYRDFSVQSGIVGPTEFTAAASGFTGTAGAFLSGDQLYYSDLSTGTLRRTAFVGGKPTGTATTVPGAVWRARAVFLGPVPNVAPSASFTQECVGLICSFDASASADSDGTVASYTWEFGDGTTATGAQVRHTYTDGGDRSVRLTVTDDDGATGVSTVVVTVTPPAADTGISLRGTAEVSGTRVTSLAVTVPAAVRAGDGLVMVLSTNGGAGIPAPAGWTAVGEPVVRSVLATQVFQRVAAAGDAGTRLTVDLGGSRKATMQLLAYAGTDAAGPIASVTGASESGGTSHTTPTATATSGDWVVSVWSDKSGAAREFDAPATAVERSNLAGSGTGDVATLVADSGAGLPSGQVGGLTATVPTASSLATMLTVVLAPGSGTPPPVNAAPTAEFSSSCAQLACSFDASGSADDEGITSYAWEFGDGSTATGPVVEHTYGADGDYTVRLTVTDGLGATGESTALVTAAAPVEPGTGIGLRGSAGSSDRKVTSMAVTVPASVQHGDGLVLVLSSNTGGAVPAPAGWSAVGEPVVRNTLATQLFQRVAVAADAGSQVTVELGGSGKATLQLLAYSGTAATGPVASVTGASESGGTAHTTPTATAPAGAWVLSVWSDKSADAREFDAPVDLSERSNLAGIGTGDIATLVADSGAALAGGQVGGLTATVASPSSLATMLTVIIVAAG